jgi:hypothetical protein
MSRGSTGSDPAVDNSELQLSSCCLAGSAKTENENVDVSRGPLVMLFCNPTDSRQDCEATVKLSSVTERRNLMGSEYSGGREALVGSRLAADTVGPR